MDAIEQAIEDGYQFVITQMYKAFSEQMLAANDNQEMIAAEQERFKNNLVRAENVHKVARIIAGL